LGPHPRATEGGSVVPLAVAVIGTGYWGPNLVRNFQAHPDTHVRWVCDLSEERAKRVVAMYGDIRTTASIDDVLNDPLVEAVVVATPPETHRDLGLAALDAGKHVLIEKPLAGTLAEARDLVDAAARADRILMCDHTYCYTPAVAKIRELVRSGVLGDIQYVDSTRINLGLIQSAVDVLWDLAPHDLSILDFVLPPEQSPTAVSAFTADPLGVGRACVGFLTLPLPGGGVGHVHVNWLSPTKIRRTVIAGTQRMLVWDDLEPAQRLTVFDKGVDLSEPLDVQERTDILVSYRVGDMVAPALPEREALRGVVDELVASIREHRPPLTDGESGLRVVRTLAAAEQSARSASALVPLESVT
jgi:predicted dehydrogenase